MDNGCLLIQANNEDRAELKCQYEQGGYPRAEDFVIESMGQLGYDWVLPEECGALTSAPIFSDEKTMNDEGEVTFVGDVWWFPNYMLDDPWEILKNRGRVILDPEEDNKSLKKARGA